LVARAQQPPMPVIGYLSVGAPIGHLLGLFKQPTSREVVDRFNKPARSRDLLARSGGAAMSAFTPLSGE